MWPIPCDTGSIPVPPTSTKRPLTCGNAGQGPSSFLDCRACRAFGQTRSSARRTFRNRRRRLRGGNVLQLSARTCRRLPAAWLEALVLAAGYTLYQSVQILVVGSRRSAVDRATWVWSIEQTLHVDPEVWLNHFVAERYWLVVVTGLYYGILHFAVTPLVLVWLRARRPDRYVSVRNTLVGASVAALIVYWLLPLAPPRLSVPAVIDTMKVNDILSAGSPSGLAALANQYAAMPSLHVAWAVWVALAVAVAFPGARVRHLAWAYPRLDHVDRDGNGPPLPRRCRGCRPTRVGGLGRQPRIRRPRPGRSTRYPGLGAAVGE